MESPIEYGQLSMRRSVKIVRKHARARNLRSVITGGRESTGNIVYGVRMRPGGLGVSRNRINHENDEDYGESRQRRRLLGENSRVNYATS